MCRSALVLVCLLLSTATVVYGEDCSAYAFPENASAIALSRVMTDRASFFDDIPPCPLSGTNCKKAAYVVKGDLLFTTRTVGAYTCSAFVSGAKQFTGWIETSALAPATWPAASVPWIGKWLRLRSNRTEVSHASIQPSGKDLTATLEATAEISAENVRSGAASGTLHLMQRDNEALATLTDGDDPAAACKVTLRQSGDLLIVSDGATFDNNSDCGGMGVTLSGIYRRVTKHK